MPEARLPPAEEPILEGWLLVPEFRGARAAELERDFRLEQRSGSFASECLIALGLSGVHVLLAAKLWQGGEPHLAVLALAQAALQCGLAVLASLWPQRFASLKPAIRAAHLLGGAAQSMLLARSSHAVACVHSSGLGFWLAQLSSWGAPLVVVHAALFPDGLLLSAVLYGVAVGLLLLGNPARCAATLVRCPAAGGRYSATAALLSRATSVFALAPRFAAGPGGGGAAAAAPDPLQACVALASATDLLSYLAVLHLAWGLQRAARLAYVRGVGDVRQEWLLERSARSTPALALELAAAALLCWQAAELLVMPAPALAAA